MQNQDRINLDGVWLREIVNVLVEYPFVERASVFGSRVNLLKEEDLRSDIDVCLYGKDLSFEVVAEIKAILNDETMIPFFIDVVHFESLKDEGLVGDIREEEVVFYSFSG